MKNIIGTSRQYFWLQGIVLFIIVLNVLDGLFTIYWVLAGQATEANPLMERLLTQHPVIFISVKMSLAILGTYLLWRLRRRPTAVIGIFLMFLVYYYVLLYHLRAMNLDLLDRLLLRFG